MSNGSGDCGRRRSRSREDDLYSGAPTEIQRARRYEYHNPEVVTPFPPAPVPSSFFVQNDYNKWELAKSATTDAVLMDRTWVSTNSCATILRKRGHVQHHTSAEFAVDGCIFISMLQTPWSPTPTDWPWTLPNFLADWEREALVNLRALTVNVFFWRGDLRDAEEFILKLGVGSE